MQGDEGQGVGWVERHCGQDQPYLLPHCTSLPCSLHPVDSATDWTRPILLESIDPDVCIMDVWANGVNHFPVCVHVCMPGKARVWVMKLEKGIGQTCMILLSKEKLAFYTVDNSYNLMGSWHYFC